MQIRGSVKSLEDLRIIDNPQQGDTAFVGEEENGKPYVYTEDNEWIELNTENKDFNLGLTQYQLSKMVIAQLPDYTNLYAAKKKIREFTHKEGQVFMLLCNELHYYTVFYLEPSGYEKIEDVVIECLQSCGTIKVIDKNPDAIECWIISSKDGEPHVFYLFNYEGGFERCV